MDKFTDVKLEVFVPQDHALTLRDELAKPGVGVIGKYDHCVALTSVRGFYRPLKAKQARSMKWRNISLKSQARASWCGATHSRFDVISLANHLFWISEE